ncbi:hypothetical protein TNCT_313281 [Trichonephila clavata]|uniref:Uncharacterized protein n=1 Tax=Trichonephila clavata TaxID=2740835 RepID=A0A8X6KVA2_TRICU|nr:hypothetical protein TNCT_313281 [Trichonephila clavata]
MPLSGHIGASHPSWSKKEHFRNIARNCSTLCSSMWRKSRTCDLIPSANHLSDCVISEASSDAVQTRRWSIMLTRDYGMVLE